MHVFEYSNKPSCPDSPYIGPPADALDLSLDPQNVPPDMKKEGPDWFAVFHATATGKDGKGKLKRGLDVTLVHTLMHERCVLFRALLQGEQRYGMQVANKLADMMCVRQCGVLRALLCRWQIPRDRVQPHRANI